MQVDGSVVKLEDYLFKAERNALRQVKDASEVMVCYRFEAVPGAVPMAVPRTYHGALFQTAAHAGQGRGPRAEQREKQASSVQRSDAQPGDFPWGSQPDSGSLQPVSKH